jgi:thiamine-phosphate pyrophosphorylase
LGGVEVNADSIFRILDANANRAREGLRTAEDYIRFSVGAVRWAKRLRTYRHALTEVVDRIVSPERLVAARRVNRDIGHPAANTEAHAPGASSARDVALRGLKRAEEAIRVLEEYVRGLDAEAARRLSEVRFGAYEAEQWTLLCGDRALRLSKACLYVLLTESQCRAGLEQTARAAIRGGAQVIQLREKELEGAEQMKWARRLRDTCSEGNALLIVNDRVDVAIAAGADGVHVGQKDLSPDEVRQVAGESLLIGRSTHSVEQARVAVEKEGSDYIAVGSMYATRTKEGFELRGPQLARAVYEENWPVPVFAIGGITAQSISELRAAGVKRVAVSSAVAESADPERAARDIREALDAS